MGKGKRAMQPRSKLRMAREARGLTLVQVAEIVGYDAGNLSKLERFEIRSIDIALKLVDFFGKKIISMEDILRAPKDWPVSESAEI